MRRGFLGVAIVVLASCATTTAAANTSTSTTKAAVDACHPVTPMTADAAKTADQLTGLLNDYRQKQNLPPLPRQADLDAVATGWAQHLHDQQALQHNPNLARNLTALGVQWKLAGENIGQAATSDLDNLNAYFIASPTHQTNMINPLWTDVGVGVVQDMNRLWVVYIFREDVYNDCLPPVLHR